MDENLGTNILFMLDAIVNADTEDPNPATINAALALTHFAWNREIQGDSITSKNYKKVLRESERVNPRLWNELARKSSEEPAIPGKKLSSLFTSIYARLG